MSIQNNKNAKKETVGPRKQTRKTTSKKATTHGYEDSENDIATRVTYIQPDSEVYDEYEEIEEIKGFESYLNIPKYKKEYVNQIKHFTKKGYNEGFQVGVMLGVSLAMLFAGFAIMAIGRANQSRRIVGYMVAGAGGEDTPVE